VSPGLRGGRAGARTTAVYLGFSDGERCISAGVPSRPPRADQVPCSEVGAPAPIDGVASADTYRLMTRECEIALLVGDGLDLQSIALELGVSIGTVRHHLKHTFEKTGARSQAALAALLRGFRGS
jgi:DNA-binding CsgD family transcriptional regulator